MKEYTNKDSQRSDGCFADDGGHMCPFLSGAVDMVVAKERDKMVESGVKEEARVLLI
jgi:hypothetical protein